ncbi:MAG: hypothetical protein K6G26_13490 [Lachnospiraceae bacterium]|nr:hypothetical protein [Lachnospiraceae bacterium]
MSKVDNLKAMLFSYGMNNRRKSKSSNVEYKMEKILREIKCEEDDCAYEQMLKSMWESPLLSQFLDYLLFPIGESEIGQGAFFPFTESLRFEIRHLVFILKFHSDKINDFVKYREKYDDYVLLNQYDRALDIVTEVKKKYGESLWAYECLFFLNADNSNNINRIMEPLVNSTCFYLIPAYFFELKNRNTISGEEYYYISEREMERWKNLWDENNDGQVEFYKYTVSGNKYSCNPDEAVGVLKFIARCPLIDQYLYLNCLCKEMLRHPQKGEVYESITRYIQELKEIEDSSFDTIRFLYDSLENKKKYTIKTGLDTAKRLFVLGKLKEARCETERLLTRYPNNVEGISLLAELNILLSDGYSPFDGTNLGMILKNLENVYGLASCIDDSIQKINKLALQCSFSTWGLGLMSCVWGRIAATNSDDREYYAKLSNIQHLDIETVLA